MKRVLLLIFTIFVPLLLSSQTVVIMEEDKYSNAERVEEVSEVMEMILSQNFSDAVFESVERNTGASYGGEITAFVKVSYNPYRWTFSVKGRDDLPESFERAFAKVLVSSRLSADLEELVKKSNSIRSELNILKERKASESLSIIEKEQVESEIAVRERQLKELLSKIGKRRSKWIVAQTPVLISRPNEGKREPDDTDNPVNSPENPKNQPDD